MNGRPQNKGGTAQWGRGYGGAVVLEWCCEPAVSMVARAALLDAWLVVLFRAIDGAGKALQWDGGSAAN